MGRPGGWGWVQGRTRAWRGGSQVRLRAGAERFRMGSGRVRMRSGVTRQPGSEAGPVRSGCDRPAPAGPGGGRTTQPRDAAATEHASGPERRPPSGAPSGQPGRCGEPRARAAAVLAGPCLRYQIGLPDPLDPHPDFPQVLPWCLTWSLVAAVSPAPSSSPQGGVGLRSAHCLLPSRAEGPWPSRRPRRARRGTWVSATRMQPAAAEMPSGVQ